MRTREIPKMLMKKNEELRKYCHKDDCDTWNRCPQLCDCGNVKYLNLNTAMAWEAAECFNVIGHSLKIFLRTKRLINFTRFTTRDYISRLTVINGMINYHKDKYHELKDLILTPYYILINNNVIMNEFSMSAINRSAKEENK